MNTATSDSEDPKPVSTQNYTTQERHDSTESDSVTPAESTATNEEEEKTNEENQKSSSDLTQSEMDQGKESKDKEDAKTDSDKANDPDDSEIDFTVEKNSATDVEENVDEGEDVGEEKNDNDSAEGDITEEENENPSNQDGDDNAANQQPVISHSTANFSLASINPHIICTLCNGYFRDPYTITECLHAFCKSCLFFAFQSGFRKCPKCEASLEPDPYREVLSDRTLGELVHKILPHLKDQDDRDEIEFYERRGIKRKAEFKKNDERGKLNRLDYEKAEKDKRKLKMQLLDSTGDEIDFVLIPARDVAAAYAMPTLLNPLLRTSGKLKIVQLKKFLLKKLNIDVLHSTVDILCNGDRLGDELSLTFVYRTRWVESSEDLCLNYRFAQEGLY